MLKIINKQSYKNIITIITVQNDSEIYDIYCKDWNEEEQKYLESWRYIEQKNKTKKVILPEFYIIQTK